MAGQAEKKLAKHADSTIVYYLYAIIGVNALYFIWKVLLNWSSMGKWNLMGLPLFLFVSNFTYKGINSSLQIGASYELYLDLYAVNITTQFLVTFTDYGWLLYLVVPGYGGWKILGLVKDYVFTPTSDELASDDPAGVEENEEAHGESLSLIIYRWKEDSCIEVFNTSELSSFSFFHRGPMREHIKFHSRLIASRTPLGQRQSIDFDQNLGKCHAWNNPCGLCATALVDGEYPMRVAFTLCAEVIRMFAELMAGKYEDAPQDLALACPEIEALFQKFQNPAEADKLTKIEKDLEEVKGTVMQSMDDLLKRGESLDQLMQKSKDLSSTSVQFYRTAKKNNQCCKMY
ncbi:unnamed protein product [Polarella glacialis]|uniref:V-SNARE coiled-coil homology domain-containing protein n=1 Tax=Polarella glacialis TaxID=89957 RepID=A0A813EQI7_POLGL|nr:unnamed protein product [Polarella glacialis]